MKKKIATPEDVLKYPELALEEGQEFEVPEALNEGNENNEDPTEDDEDTGGNHPTKPPGKP